ncbi:hypothetical protein C0J52_12605, partial [Blattella germanica]
LIKDEADGDARRSSGVFLLEPPTLLAPLTDAATIGDKDDVEDVVNSKLELELVMFVKAVVGGIVTKVIGITLLGFTIMAAASLPTKSKLKFEFDELLFPLCKQPLLVNHMVMSPEPPKASSKSSGGSSLSDKLNNKLRNKSIKFEIKKEKHYMPTREILYKINQEHLTILNSEGERDKDDVEDVVNSKLELELVMFVKAVVGGIVTKVIGITLLGFTIMAAASLPTKSKLKFEFDELLFPLCKQPLLVNHMVMSPEPPKASSKSSGGSSLSDKLNNKLRNKSIKFEIKKEKHYMPTREILYKINQEHLTILNSEGESERAIVLEGMEGLDRRDKAQYWTAPLKKKKKKKKKKKNKKEREINALHSTSESNEGEFADSGSEYFSSEEDNSSNTSVWDWCLPSIMRKMGELRMVADTSYCADHTYSLHWLNGGSPPCLRTRSKQIIQNSVMTIDSLIRIYSNKNKNKTVMFILDSARITVHWFYEGTVLRVHNPRVNIKKRDRLAFWIHVKVERWPKYVYVLGGGGGGGGGGNGGGGPRFGAGEYMEIMCCVLGGSKDGEEDVAESGGGRGGGGGGGGTFFFPSFTS